MAHVRMGVCDAPTSHISEDKCVCPYCKLEPIYIKRIQPLSSEIDLEPRQGSLFQNVCMDRRVPDLLHMVKNVTQWLLKNTATYIHPMQTDSNRRNARVIKNKQKKWIRTKMTPFLYKSRTHSSSGIPKSEHTAYWDLLFPRVER